MRVGVDKIFNVSKYLICTFCLFRSSQWQIRERGGIIWHSSFVSETFRCTVGVLLCLLGVFIGPKWSVVFLQSTEEISVNIKFMCSSSLFYFLKVLVGRQSDREGERERDLQSADLLPKWLKAKARKQKLCPGGQGSKHFMVTQISQSSYQERIESQGVGGQTSILKQDMSVLSSGLTYFAEMSTP